MNVNLSKEVINTVYNSLISSKQHLNFQLNFGNASDKHKEIIKYQLEEVKNALKVFEELVELV